MKTIVTYLVCAALVLALIKPQPAKAQVAPVVFIMACGVIATCIIIKVSSVPPRAYVPVTLVLEKSTDGRATWTAICTNTVVLGTAKPISVFTDQMTDDMAFYRVHELGK